MWCVTYFNMYPNIVFLIIQRSQHLEIMFLQCNGSWLCVNDTGLLQETLIPGAKDRKQSWWQRVLVNSNRRLNLLRVSASTAVSHQLMCLSYFVNRPYNTLSDYVTLFLCYIFEYQVDIALKRGFKRFWSNPERFQIQWHFLGLCFSLFIAFI